MSVMVPDLIPLEGLEHLGIQYSLSMDLSRLPNEFQEKKRSCRVVIETPKGRRNKFDYDPKIEAFTLGGLLAEGLSFPFDFGFVPSTIAEDGDPLDVMVLMDEPAHVGCVLSARLIGIMQAEQTEDGRSTPNDRLIAVALHSYSHENIRSISELNPSVLKQVGEFFVSYNKSRGKKFKVTGLGGPSKAIKRLKKAIDSCKVS
jgi:inorganic pyrophosphatase